MPYDTNAYVINHLNFALQKQNRAVSIRFTKRTSALVKALHHVGCIDKYIITKEAASTRAKITFSVFYYKGTPFFKGVRLVSTPSKEHNISFKSLKIASKFLHSTIVILSTPQGLITHTQALKERRGGRILCIVT